MNCPFRFSDVNLFITWIQDLLWYHKQGNDAHNKPLSFYNIYTLKSAFIFSYPLSKMYLMSLKSVVPSNPAKYFLNNVLII